MSLFCQSKIRHRRDRAQSGRRLLRQRILQQPTYRKILTLTAAVLMASCLQAGGRGYSQKITLTVKNSRLEKVFDQIHKISQYTFAYTKEALAETKAVTFSVKEAAIGEVMDIALKDQGLSWTQVDDVVVIKKKSQAAAIEPTKRSDTRDIQGKVTNEKGEPVAGATVSVRGTRKGTSTAADGTFSLNDIDEKATIEVTSIGYEIYIIMLPVSSPVIIQLRVVAQ